MLNNTQWYETLLTTCQHKNIDIKHWIVAFSGGVDSCVLLHLLQQTTTLPITMVHVNHQLNKNAKAWEDHCKTLCKTWGLECRVETVNAKPAAGQSPEAAAREARYAALEKHITTKNHCLLTAHHQDDQAETFLLQLCRGAGVKGLAAMPVMAAFSEGYLARPLLFCSRKEIVDYAKQHQLTWIDDDTNADPEFDRNFIRHHIIPVLENHWPSVTKTIARAASHCANSSDLNHVLGEIDLAAASGNGFYHLSLDVLKGFSQARQANLLRTWFHSINFPTPSAAQLECILAEVCFADEKANPVFYFSNDASGRQLRRYQNHLYAIKVLPKSLDPDWKMTWDLRTSLLLPNGLGTLSAEIVKDSDYDLLLPEDAKLEMKTYNGHLRFHPKERAHSQTLKNLCQEWKIPPWERASLLILQWKETAVAVFHPALKCRYFTKTPALKADNKKLKCWLINFMAADL
ncbi:MAG: tRNA(Ile)-lysidine synthetase [Gammaproteobacteria bacterium]|jgi:tRNA(Ile)-lysidine synthase|nr:tRNA(Ile)-lysidine synthetase [Gammaproteobacteria bacterium]